MRSSAYEFANEWLVDATAAECWALLVAPGAAGVRWPGVELRLPEPLEAGGAVALDVRSGLGYRLRVAGTLTEVEPAHRLTAECTGDLAGTGVVALDEHEGRTLVRITWAVRTERRWMNAVAPLARPAFARAHERVMRRGERAFRAALGTRASEARNAANPGGSGADGAERR